MASPRTIVRDKIAALVPDGITVYEVGEDVIATPCVVVHAADPYQVPTTMGADASIQVFLDIYVVSNRALIKDAMRQLEEMRRNVTDGIKDEMTAPVGRWTTFGRFGTIEVGGAPYAAGIVEAVFVMADDPPSA